MKNVFKLTTLALLLLANMVVAQTPVSGYINIEKTTNWKPIIYLSQISTTNSGNSHQYTTVATAPIAKNGYFSFDQQWFSQQNQLYKIHVKPYSKSMVNTVPTATSFILSKNDTLFFEKGNQVFGSYTTTNNADQEWQKLKKFEAKFSALTDDFDTEHYLLKTKGYVKDSLQILLVKLIGIKKLDDKRLLEQDIKVHTSYYTQLLKELKSSDINPELFLYLENKIFLVQNTQTNQKYTMSLWGNGIALIVITILAFLFIKHRKKVPKTPISPLSKQENIIKELIISGKSNKEIANELFISISTVKTHISNIYSKLNITNRQELVLKK